MLSPFRMVCRDFILPEPASYVFFYAIFNLRNLLYIIAKRKASQQKRKEENQHKYMMGGIVHKYFPECYQFDEQELNRIIASGMKSEQCQRIIEIVKKESAEKRENAVVKAESEVAGDEGTGKSENA